MKEMTQRPEYPATNEQKQLIHRLKRRYDLDDDIYRNLILQYSGGRTSTSSELTKEEARRLISRLLDRNGTKEEVERKKYCLVCRIYRLSCKIPELNAFYDVDDPIEREMNIAKLNKWLRQYGTCKKPLSRQTYEELKMTHKQMKAWGNKK